MSDRDQELESRLRALSGALPALDVGPAFADTVRRRAVRTRRLRTGIAGVAAVAVAAAAAVPAVVLDRARHSTASAGRAAATDGTASDVPYTYSGLTVGWLPEGLAHYTDGGTVESGGIHFYSGDLPPLAISSGAVGPTSVFVSFTPPTASETAGTVPSTASIAPPRGPEPTVSDPLPAVTSAGGPAGQVPTGSAAPTGAAAARAITHAWLGYTWDGPSIDVPSIEAYLATTPGGPRDIKVAADTVAGQQAFLLRGEVATVVHGYQGPSDREYAALVWRTPVGATMVVELAAHTPVDAATLHRVADSLTLSATRPISARTPTAPASTLVGQDEAAILAAIHDVFTAGTPPDRWEAALQDGEALSALRARAEATYPQLARTIQVAVNTLTRTGPGTANASITLTFSDPTIPIVGGARMPYRFGMQVTLVRSDAGWQVARSGYCGAVSALATQGLNCG